MAPREPAFEGSTPSAPPQFCLIRAAGVPPTFPFMPRLPRLPHMGWNGPRRPVRLDPAMGLGTIYPGQFDCKYLLCTRL